MFNLARFANRGEIAAVIGHEAGHIVLGDTKIKTLQYAIAGVGKLMLALPIGGQFVNCPYASGYPYILRNRPVTLPMTWT